MDSNQLQCALHLIKTKIPHSAMTSQILLLCKLAFKTTFSEHRLNTHLQEHFFEFKVKYPDTVLRSTIRSILILTQTVPVYLHGGLTQILALGFDKGHIKQTLMPVS